MSLKPWPVIPESHQIYLLLGSVTLRTARVELLPAPPLRRSWSELIWLPVTSPGGGGAFQIYTKECTLPIRIWAITDACNKLLARSQWRGQSRCGLGLLQNTQEFLLQSARTPAYRVCWRIQLLVPPLGNLLTLKSLTFRTSFSVFHCLPAPGPSPAPGKP